MTDQPDTMTRLEEALDTLQRVKDTLAEAASQDPLVRTARAAELVKAAEDLWHAALAVRDQAMDEAVSHGYRSGVVTEAGELSKSQAAKRRRKWRAAQTTGGAQ